MNPVDCCKRSCFVSILPHCPHIEGSKSVPIPAPWRWKSGESALLKTKKQNSCYRITIISKVDFCSCLQKETRLQIKCKIFGLYSRTLKLSGESGRGVSGPSQVQMRNPEEKWGSIWGSPAGDEMTLVLRRQGWQLSMCVALAAD